MKFISVAIDGPAGSGKSSVSKIVASQVQYLYIDTGAMYRAVTLALQEAQVDICDEVAVERMLAQSEISLNREAAGYKVYLNGRDVTTAIRTPIVSDQVSSVAALGVVRRKMVELQRQMAAGGGVILDGRDIGTVVLPQAELKIFLTASVEARAKRRFAEYQQQGEAITLDAVIENIKARDYQDSHREIAPLTCADDAIIVDNSNLSLEETAAYIIKLIKEKQA